jgi:lipopolysaccharide export system permease protein
MTLHFYIAKQFYKIVAIIMAIFTVIMLPVDLADQVRRVGVDDGVWPIVQLSILNLPSNLYELIPLFVLLGALFSFLGLARSSELVIVRAAGRSALSSVFSPVCAALVLGVFVVAVVNPLVASSKRQYDLLKARYSGVEQQVASFNAEGLWLRQAVNDTQSVIHAQATNSDATHLFGVSFFRFDDQGRLTQRIRAQQAILTPGAWDVTNGTSWPFAGANNPQAYAQDFDQRLVPTTLTREQIRDSFGNPATVSVYDMPDFIGQLNAAGFAALQHRVWWQVTLASPLMLATMVLIAASFTVQPSRLGQSGLMILAAVLLGFAVFFLGSFVQVLGTSGQVAPAVVAWLPAVAAFLAALGLFLHMEDG